jgi:hypothetical protein
VFTQSFHWMDRTRVARAVFAMLESDGAWGRQTHDARDTPF